MEFINFFLLLFTIFQLTNAAKEPLVAPFVDVTRMPPHYLTEVSKETGLKAVTLAFVLGTGYGCDPSWGGENTLNDANILNNVKEFQELDGKVILATGGAMGPYLESSCKTVDELANGYKKALDIVNSSHLDIDIEATIKNDLVMDALKKLRSMITNLTISFTLMVQGDDYGLNDDLGINILKNAVKHGLEINIVNAMTMEFGTKLSSWGDAVIAAGESIHKQLKQVWPEKSEAELYTMLGITPMIGRNFNGKIFKPEHAENLIQWAKEKKIGHLSFWSLGRDNGNCPGGGVSPDCSSILQRKLEFSKIFQKYSGTHIPNHFSTTILPTIRPKTTKRFTSKPKIDCSNGVKYIPHEKYCDKYYWCFEGKPHLEQCPQNTVWDPRINSCNFSSAAKRTDCI